MLYSQTKYKLFKGTILSNEVNQDFLPLLRGIFFLSFAALGMEPRAVCMPTKHSVLKLYPDPLEPSYTPIFLACVLSTLRSLRSPYNSTPTASCEHCAKTPKPCCPGVSGYKLSNQAQWHITFIPTLGRQRHRRTSGV